MLPLPAFPSGTSQPLRSGSSSLVPHLSRTWLLSFCHSDPLCAVILRSYSTLWLHCSCATQFQSLDAVLLHSCSSSSKLSGRIHDSTLPSSYNVLSRHADLTIVPNLNTSHTFFSIQLLTTLIINQYARYKPRYHNIGLVRRILATAQQEQFQRQVVCSNWN